MRWKGIIFIAVFIGIFLILNFIFSDAWLESTLEDIATSANKAKVEIDNLDFSFFGPIISWDRLQITNPKNTMRNMIESGFCEFKMEFWPLLSKKVIIENIQINDLRTNTERESDGKVEIETMVEQIAESNYVKETANRLRKKVESTPTIQLAGQVDSGDIDSIMAILDIRSVDKIDSLQKQLEGKYDNWQQKLLNLNYDRNWEEVEQKVKSFDVNQIKSVEDFRAALNKIEEVKSVVDNVSNDLQTTKSELETDLKSAHTSVNLVDDWVAEDYQKALSMAKLPEINAQNIGEMIFGKKLVTQIIQYLGYVGEARSYTSKFQSDRAEKQNPPRLKGQDIYFYNKNARPDFWIQKIELSGETENQIHLSGIIENIVSDQKQISAPTQINIGGASESGSSIKFTGKLNYLEKIPQENFKLLYAGFSLANTKISDSNLLPNTVKNGVGNIESKFNLRGDKIDGKIKFTGYNLEFEFSENANTQNKLDEMIISIIKSVSEVDFLANIQGEGDKLNFNLNSNLDDLFVKKMKAVLSKEVEEAKQKIKTRIDSEVNKYRKQLNIMITEKEKLLNSEVNKYERQLNTEKSRVDKKKKEVEAKIEKEKSKQLNKVKDIFKF